MMTSDNNSWHMRSFHRKLAISLIIVAVALSGCSKASQKAGDLWDSIKGDKKGEQKEIKDEIILEKPVLKPTVISPGKTVQQELKYSILSAKTGKLKVTEVIVLSGNGLKIELSRKVHMKLKGDHTSTFQFIVPKDLPTGQYELLTSIMFEKESKNTSGSFRLKR